MLALMRGRPIMLAAILASLGACSRHQAAETAASAIGDPDRGAQRIAEVGCGSCHAVRGRNDMNGLVGPPLDAMGRRTIIAGVLANTPPNMIRWIRAPQSVVPGNAMPNTNLSEQDARDITAYLYTLR